MSVVAFIRDLLAKGLPLEQALLAAETMEAQPRKGSSSAERMRRLRARRAGDVTSVTSDDVTSQASQASQASQVTPVPLTESFPHTPFKENTLPFEEKKTGRVREASTIIPAISTIIEPEAAGTTAPAIAVPTVEAEFSEFWRAYPHRVGRPEAFKAFIRARTGERVRGKPQRKPVPLAAILEGVANYTRDKPPDHNWLNPSTFLNQERYADEPAAVMGRRRDTTTAELGDMLAQARLDIEREERAEHDPRRQIAHGYG